MAESPSPSVNPQEDRLDSWKEIAAYLNRDVTTVQRWEKREGMPVHRHQHDRIGSIHASRAELDLWVRSRQVREDQTQGEANDAPPEAPTPTPQPVPYAAPVRFRVILSIAVAAAALAIASIVLLQKSEYFWRDPLHGARFQPITDFDGVEKAAAISRDGHLVAFLSDRDGPTDVWITQVGSGQFHNLTNGTTPGLTNPSIRNLSFSPDASLVTYWVRNPNSAGGGGIAIWAVPTLGGQPRQYLQGGAEIDWAHDSPRFAWHTPGPGDPLFVSDGEPGSQPKLIFTAPPALHSHFPLWSPDAAFLYFVQGTLPDKLDIWRIPSSGGIPERITTQNAAITYPVFLNRHTLLYLAGDPDGSGPSLYSIDTERRVPHRLTAGPDRYTSAAASADGRRLVVTLAGWKKTLWRLPIPDSSPQPKAASFPTSAPASISLATSTGSSPRLGPGYLLYVSTAGAGENIWKLANGTSTELWSADGAQISGGPTISADGGMIAFTARLQGRPLLYVMQADGTNPHIVAKTLDLQGDPSWSPDGRSIVTAAMDQGTPHVVRVPIDGSPSSPFVSEYSMNPAWSPDGGFLVYSGPDTGTTFQVKAINAAASPHTLPELTLTRGARRLVFLRDQPSLVFLRGDIQHKDLWLLDLKTNSERQLTNLPHDFDIRDFDISSDGREVVLERVQERSDLVLIDLPKP